MGGETFGIVTLKEKTGTGDDFRSASSARCDDWQPTGHALEASEAKRFIPAGWYDMDMRSAKLGRQGGARNHAWTPYGNTLIGKLAHEAVEFTLVGIGFTAPVETRAKNLDCKISRGCGKFECCPEKEVWRLAGVCAAQKVYDGGSGRWGFCRRKCCQIDAIVDGSDGAFRHLKVRLLPAAGEIADASGDGNSFWIFAPAPGSAGIGVVKEVKDSGRGKTAAQEDRHFGVVMQYKGHFGEAVLTDGADDLCGIGPLADMAPMAQPPLEFKESPQAAPSKLRDPWIFEKDRTFP